MHKLLVSYYFRGQCVSLYCEMFSFMCVCNHAAQSKKVPRHLSLTPLQESNVIQGSDSANYKTDEKYKDQNLVKICSTFHLSQ